MIETETISAEPGNADARAARLLHILMVTGSYAPDPTGMAVLNTDLCEYLAWRGHRVSVVTCFPHYPKWEVPQAYRSRFWLHETRNGVDLYRSWVFIPGRRTTLRRILYDTSIGFSAALRGLPIRQVDLLLAVSPPLQAGLAGCFLAQLKGAPLLLEIQDLVLDLAIALGMLRNPWAIKLARILENQLYRRAEAILVISEGFAANLAGKGLAKSKVFFLPLWVDAGLISPGPRNGPFRKTHHIGEAQTVVLYTGNMGAKQKLENMLEAAAQLQPRQDVLFLFVGDGTEKAGLQEYAQNKGLSNVRFLPLLPPQPRELLPEMLSAADVLVLNQSAQVVDMVIPSKLFTYMAAGRPVVAAVNASSEAAACIRQAGCGFVVDAENPAALAEAIYRLHLDRELAGRLGRQGRLYVEEHCARERLLNSYEDLFLALAKNKFERVALA